MVVVILIDSFGGSFMVCMVLLSSTHGFQLEFQTSLILDFCVKLEISNFWNTIALSAALLNLTLFIIESQLAILELTNVKNPFKYRTQRGKINSCVAFKKNIPR